MATFIKNIIVILLIFKSLLSNTLPENSLGTFEGSLDGDKYKIVLSSLANGVDLSVTGQDGRTMNESSIYNIISTTPDNIIEFSFKSKFKIKLTFIPLLNQEQWEMSLGPKTIFLKKNKSNTNINDLVDVDESLPSSDTYQFCPNDGFPNTGGKFTFCPKCGSSLKSENKKVEKKAVPVESSDNLFNLDDAISSPIANVNSNNYANAGKLVQPPKEIPEKYCIQIASKPELNQARNLRREIYDKNIIDMNNQKGFGVYIDEVMTEKDFFWYRVRIQPYSDKNVALNDKDKLANHYGKEIWVDFVRQLSD